MPIRLIELMLLLWCASCARGGETETPPDSGDTGKPTSSNGQRIAAGFDFTCAIREDASIECWGNDEHGNLNAPDGEYIHVDAAGNTACALDTDGKLACWGRLTYQIDQQGSYYWVAANEGKACTVSAAGAISCSGSSPPNEMPDGRFELVDLGDRGRTLCGLTREETLSCRGGTDVGIDSPPDDQMLAVSMGSEHACALRKADGQVVCWGDDSLGQRQVPKTDAVGVHAGEFHSCAWEEDGATVCWGYDVDGESTPPMGLAAAEVACGEYHCCARTLEGGYSCWGSNDDGQCSSPE